MPTKPKKYCTYPGCKDFALKHSNYCSRHRTTQSGIKRPNPNQRGYGATWRRVREKVLINAGIPRAEWGLYDVDHRPAYNPAIEPDHNKYTLVPMLHAEHSKKTAREDGGFGNKSRGKKDGE